jgi:hypothetical protein
MQRLKKESSAIDFNMKSTDPPSSTDFNGTRVVKLVVPRGLKGGETIVVEVQNGSFYEIQLPEGSLEGDEIEVEIPL